MNERMEREGREDAEGAQRLITNAVMHSLASGMVLSRDVRVALLEETTGWKLAVRSGATLHLQQPKK